MRGDAQDMATENHGEETACAFLSTSFGFGPVSKAATIARELKEHAPHLEAHYFGAGIDYDYAAKSDSFERVFKVDVDERATLAGIVPRLASYRAVFSVLNLDVLSLWRRGRVPLYLVDSLAWMWPDAPDGLTNVEAYFVQDYMMPPERVRLWGEKWPLVLVGPIEEAGAAEHVPPRERVNRLLVNFSGCSNPFAAPELFEKYVSVLASAIMSEAGDYDGVVFCCNERLARHLQGLFGGALGVRAGHFTHEEFIGLLASSKFVLTAPGITTTLEVIASGADACFLLPQNYSQALISERYRALLGDAACMALSRFDQKLSVNPDLPEREGVRLVIASLQEILETRGEQIRSVIREFFSHPSRNVAGLLRRNVCRHWDVPGQTAIVAHFLNFMARTPR